METDIAYSKKGPAMWEGLSTVSGKICLLLGARYAHKHGTFTCQNGKGGEQLVLRQNWTLLQNISSKKTSRCQNPDIGVHTGFASKARNILKWW